MSVVVSIPIKPRPAEKLSSHINTHIDVDVDFYKATRSSPAAGVKMSLNAVERRGGMVSCVLSFGVPGFPKCMVRAMDKNYKAKVQACRDMIREQFAAKQGEFYEGVIKLIAERGYEVLQEEAASV